MLNVVKKSPLVDQYLSKTYIQLFLILISYYPNHQLAEFNTIAYLTASKFDTANFTDDTKRQLKKVDVLLRIFLLIA